jgi:alpha-beta hydrolase superfamily lysophospholipase
VDGHRHEAVSTDGTPIGLLTAGSGPALLLVHGGMGRLERWEPMWGLLTTWRRVTAMDRRGRGSSGDTQPYQLSREFDDVAAVAASLAAGEGGWPSCPATATRPSTPRPTWSTLSCGSSSARRVGLSPGTLTGPDGERPGRPGLRR